MSDPSFSIRIDEEAPRLHLSGDIDREATDAFEATGVALAEIQGEKLLLDFSDVGYINSTGIALIVGLVGKARAAGLSLGARGLSRHYRHVFEITRLSDFIDLDADGEGTTT